MSRMLALGGAVLAAAAVFFVIFNRDRIWEDEPLSPKEARAERRAERREAAEEARRERLEARAGRFTVSASGDILIHSPVWESALANGGGASYDFAPLFEPIRPYVGDVELAVCHLETPMSETAEPSGFPLFNAPPEMAPALAGIGFDACDTASNHSLDQHQEGIDSTGDVLEDAGVPHTGSSSGPREREKPLILKVEAGNGTVRVGLVAYTDYTNGIPPPSPWSVNLLPAGDPVEDKAKVVERDVERALGAGADTVLVSFQWGDENSTTPNDSQVEMAKAITRIPGVAAIAGQGPHVVQPIDRVNEKFVVYSSGNLLSNQSALAGLPEETQYGLISLLRFAPGEAEGGPPAVAHVDYVPTMVDLDGHAIVPAGPGIERGLADPAALADAYETVVSIAGRGRGITPLPRRLP